MKNFPLLTILIFSITIATSQTILPTYEDNPVWEMQFDNYYSYENYSIILQPDTLICGQFWTPVENTNEDIYISGRIGYFREEGDKVFVRKTGNCDEEVFLMFDFSAEIGDTLIVGWGGGNPIFPYEVVVTNKGMITVNGIERRTVSVLYDAFLTPISFWWVEGIGNIDNHAPPLYSLDCSSFICSEAGYIFNCFYEDGNLSFTNPLGSQNCEFLIDTLRVNQNLSTGNNDGTDWQNAFFELQDALEIADSSTVVLVAQGTYFPTNTDDRTESFTIVDGVQLYGGFFGDEVNISDRNIEEYPTILSGDIGVLDDKLDNSYHILYALGVDSTTIIDGFIIEKGNADGMPLSSNEAKGGGFLIDTDIQTPKANPTIKNCIFRNNSAVLGGGIYCKGIIDEPSLQSLEDCVFDKNSSSQRGGGLFKEGGGIADKTIFNNCLFSENKSILGGGIYFGDILGLYEIENCRFFKDSSNFEGGGISILTSTLPVDLNIINSNFIENRSNSGGGLSFVYVGFPTPDSVTYHIDSCIFDKNEASQNIGGGIYIGNTGVKDDLTIRNTTFSNNTSFNAGGGVSYGSSEMGDSKIILDKCTFNNNSSTNFFHGGAFYYRGQGNGNSPISNNSKISNCQFYENKGAVSFTNGALGTLDAILTNCTFYHNGDLPILKTWVPDFDTISYYNNMTISNSIIWEETPIELLFSNGNFTDFTNHNYFINNCLLNVPNCIVNGVDACTEGMIYEQNPLFKDPLNNDFRLAACSPAINSGNNAYLQMEDTLDLAAMPRIIENIVDMGAYERDSFATEILEIIDETCADAMDGEIIVATQGDAPFTFDWQVDTMMGEGLTDLSMGDYFLIISDSLGCADTVNVTIGGSEPIEIFATIETASAATVEDGAIFIDSIMGGTEPYSFAWETGDTTIFLESLATGMYTLTVTDANGCEKEVVFDVSFMSGTTSGAIADVDFKLHPNPFKDELFLNWNEQFQPDFLVIYDVLGKVVFRENNLNTQHLKLAELPSGVYFLTIGNEEKRIIQQIVKR